MVTACEIYLKWAVSPFITLPKVTIASNVLFLSNKHLINEGISKAPGTLNIDISDKERLFFSKVDLAHWTRL